MATNKIFDTVLAADKILLYKNDEFVVEDDITVGITNGSIEFIGKPSSNLKSKQNIELKNHLLLPGLVNTHTHLPMSLFRGLADNLPLIKWLENYIFPLEGALLDKNFIGLGTRLSAVELIKSGVTTCCDMYFYNKSVAEAVDVAGLRALIGVAVPSVEKDWQQWKQKTLDLQKQYKNNSRIQAALAPHAPYTVSSDVLKQMGDFSKKENLFLSIHASESQQEQQEIKSKHGKTPIEYLHDLNVTGENSIFAHCVWASDSDLDIMAKTKTSLAYNPESNMKLSNGIAPIEEALSKGVVVGLGTDGSASNNNLNMFEEMGTGTKLQALKYGDKSLTAGQMLKMATIEGAKALGLSRKIGTIELGKKADLIAVNLQQPQFYPPHNLISHLIYSANGSEVSFTMCDGKILMQDYKLKTLNEEQIYEETLEASKKIKDFLQKKKH